MSILRTIPETNDEIHQPLSEQQVKKHYPLKVLKLIFFLGILFLILAFVIKFLLSFENTNHDFLSPIPEKTEVLSSQEIPPLKPKEIIGFLPFWNLDEEQNLRYHLLTQVVFFALEIDQNGNIRKLEDNGTEEPGWTAFKSQKFGMIYRKAKDSGTKLILTIQAMNPEELTSILNDKQKRTNAINQTLEIIELRNLDGVNIDFEYPGTPAYETTNNFTQFVKEFSTALNKKNPSLLLSIDVFAESTTKLRLWEIPKISEFADQIIIMAYDFHRAGSKIAGPIAPIRGAPEHWQYDISTTLADFSKSTPLEKIILGIPYYGYEWVTTSGERYATTYPNSGSLATFKRIQSLIDEKNPLLDWDETALAPRLIYKQGNEFRQIYYENETSLGLKYDLVNESGLSGIAIWALGYDGKYPNLWNLISEKFFLY